jgi:hypothetical protein
VTVTGKPSITTPRDESRALQMAISNIRERLEAIEGEFNGLTIPADTSTELTLLRSQIRALDVRVTQLELAGSAEDDDETYLAGEDLPIFTVVRQSADGSVVAMDPTDPDGAFYPLGITLADVVTGNSVAVRRAGTIDTAGAMFTTGRVIYADTDGSLTQSPPAGGVVIIVGFAVSTQVMSLFLQGSILNTAEDFSEDDAYLPITKQAAEDLGGGQTPFYVPVDEEFVVEENKQVLWAEPIVVDGVLTVDGILIEVEEAGGGSGDTVTAGAGISVQNLGGGLKQISANLQAGANVTIAEASGGALEISTSGAAAGVDSINGEDGAITLQAGSNVTITEQSGGVIEIAASGGGGGDTVEAGDGIAITDLSGGVKQIAADLVAGTNVTITPLSGGALEIAASGGSGGGVESLNGETGDLTLQAGANVTITPQSGGVFEIAASGGGGGDTIEAGDGITVTDLSGDVKQVSANLVAGDNITIAPGSGGSLEIDATSQQTPFYIEPLETFTVEANKQVLWDEPIEVDGWLVIDGLLIEVGDAPATTGVDSVNGETGDITLVAGTHITITPASGGAIEIAAECCDAVDSLNGMDGDLTLVAGANVTITPQSGGVIEIAAAAGGGGVESLNGETGDLTLAAGDNIVITPESGGVLRISAADAPDPGISEIDAGDGITVDVLSGNARRVSANLVAGEHITLNPLSSGAIEISAECCDAVDSLNGETGDLTLTAGANITITPQSGGVIEIAASASGGGVESLNGETGDLTLVAGANVTITEQSGGVIEIAAAGGSSGGVADVIAGGGISVQSLSADVKQVSANLQAGTNVSITPGSGDSLIISAASGDTLQGGRGITVTPQSGAVTLISVSDLPHTMEGRLSLTSNDAAPSADVTGASTVYWVPYKGNVVTLWDGTQWKNYTLSAQLSLSLSGMTPNLPHDVYMIISGGVPAISRLGWLNSTSRGVGSSAITTLDGRVVNNTNGRSQLYLGTFYAQSGTTTSDSGGGVTTQVGGQRFLWNNYNRIRAQASVIDTTDSWSYTTQTIRQAQAVAGNKVEMVVGLLEDVVEASLTCSLTMQNNSTQFAAAGIGIDSTTTFSGCRQRTNIGVNSSVGQVLNARMSQFFSTVGYHYLSWNEKGATGTCTWNGDLNDTQSGLIATLWR